MSKKPSPPKFERPLPNLKPPPRAPPRPPARTPRHRPRRSPRTSRGRTSAPSERPFVKQRKGQAEQSNMKLKAASA
eukprot:7417867-Pyramimonas_sp.AAC.1